MNDFNENDTTRASRRCWKSATATELRLIHAISLHLLRRFEKPIAAEYMLSQLAG